MAPARPHKKLSCPFLYWFKMQSIFGLLCVLYALQGAASFSASISSNRVNSNCCLPPRTHQVVKQPNQCSRVILKAKDDNISDDDDDDDDGDRDNRLPSLIIFDLDGCLWRPEMYELLYFSGGAGAPFTKSPEYETDGTILTCKSEPVRLLGQVREVMRELYCERAGKWQNTQVGISSRTDQPDWARELLEKFTITTQARKKNKWKGSGEQDSFCIQDVMNGPIEMQSDSKVQHFERISAQTGVSFEDILFFDNERGNCREVAKLGVVVAYCPDGVSKLLWDLSLKAFPTASGKVVGLDVYGYDTLEGAELFYDSDDYRRTEW